MSYYFERTCVQSDQADAAIQHYRANGFEIVSIQTNDDGTTSIEATKNWGEQKALLPILHKRTNAAE